MFMIVSFFKQDVLKYTLLGGDEAKSYFYLNPDSGVITLRKPLKFSSNAQFDVRYMITFYIDI